VYLGVQHSVGRDVAIKVVTPALLSDATIIRRFLREAKLSSRLSHPNTVSVLDFGQNPEGAFLLVMEYLSGRTLAQVMEQEGAMSPQRAGRIAAQICDALEFAHRLSIVHRDLKPANVMLLGEGRDLVKVLDFGLAKSLSPESQSTMMTRSGALLGTPAFLPPECARGGEADHRGDLYSLGVVLYYMLTARLPFTGDTIQAMLDDHAHKPPPPLGPGYSSELEALVSRLLAKEPEARYPDAAAVREAIAQATAGRTAPPAGTPALDVTIAATPAPPRSATGATAPAATGGGRARWVAVAVAFAAAAAVALWRVGSEPASPPTPSAPAPALAPPAPDAAPPAHDAAPSAPDAAAAPDAPRKRTRRPETPY
jgi:serine/threonine-protein kinase